jgi:hypothetical protein
MTKTAGASQDAPAVCFSGVTYGFKMLLIVNTSSSLVKGL